MLGMRSRAFSLQELIWFIRPSQIVVNVVAMRVRYFSEGLLIGSKDVVNVYFEAKQEYFWGTTSR